MDVVLEILKLLIPAGAVFATAYFLLKSFLDAENKKRLTDIRKNNQDMITPIRLQAYERLILFLDRISPDIIIMRVHKNGMTARFFQSELIKNIRGEYEHNLSQQLYVSNGAWELVNTAKEEIIKLVNITADKLPETASGLDLAQRILEIASQINKLPNRVAIEYLKKEVGQAF